MLRKVAVGVAAAVLTVSGGVLALAQSPPGAPAAPPQRAPRPPVSAYAKPTPFPNQDKAKVAEIISKTRKIAGEDLFQDFVHRCLTSPGYPTRVQGTQYNGVLEPTKLFDQLYFVGQVAVSSHALVTSEGIVLFDTLNNEDEARNIIVPGLQKLGLDPAKIKYVVITHGHGDHWGGARYLQKTYGAKVISSKADWDAMLRPNTNPGGAFAGLQPPDRDIEVIDGQEMKIGDTSLKFHITPGHTEGTVSTLFKVTDRGAPHVVGYHGGTGSGRNAVTAAESAKSFARWADLTKAAGADVLIANHPLHDRAIEKNEIIRLGLPSDPNPYVIGKERYNRYMQVMQGCAELMIARGVGAGGAGGGGGDDD